MDHHQVKPKRFSRIFLWISGAAIIAGILFYLFSVRLLPCGQPITYSIGSFDKRFGISQKPFETAIAQAEKIWEDPVRKQLFQSAMNGQLKINLVYDERQAATIKLQSLGVVIRDDETGYNQLKAKYEAMKVSYDQQKSALDAAVARYQNDKQAYEQQVALWNSHGGAPKNEFDKLEQQRVALNAEADQLRQQQLSFNTLVDNINAVVTVLNRLAGDLEKEAVHFNNINGSRGSEFEEGLYKSDATGSEIDIYQFDSQDKLVRVLAHELGHALGIEHVNDPKAIMYRLNQSMNEKLTTDDLNALKQRCAVGLRL